MCAALLNTPVDESDQMDVDFDFTSVVAQNLEEEINKLLANSYFGPITSEQLAKLNMKEKIECEWQEDYIKSPEEYFWLIVNNKIIGVADIENTYSTQSHTFFWIDTECTFERTDSPIATSGRLLWACILNHCSEISKINNKFVVYNRSTQDALGYHVKMGMLPYHRVGLPYEFVSKKLPHIADAEAKDEYLNVKLEEKEPTFLFYISNDSIDYSSIYNILLSLEYRFSFNMEKKYLINEKDSNRNYINNQSDYDKNRNYVNDSLNHQSDYDKNRNYKNKYIKYKMKYISLKKKLKNSKFN